MEKLKTNFSLKLGTSESGKVVKSDLSKLKNMLVVGNVGAGKTIFLQEMILNLIKDKLPNDYGVVVFDPKEVEYENFDKLPGCTVVTGLKKAGYFLTFFDGNSKIGNYKAEQGKKIYDDYVSHLKVTLLFIDELADYLADDELKSYLCEIFKNGYKGGVFPIFSTYNVQLLPDDIKKNVNSMIVFNKDNSLLPEDKKSDVVEIGRFEKILYRKDSEIVKLKPSDENSYWTVDKIVARDKRQLIFWQDFSILKDKNFQAMVELAIKEGTICATRIRKELGCGNPFAARFIDKMEKFGFVSVEKKEFSREVYITKNEFNEILKLIDER